MVFDVETCFLSIDPCFLQDHFEVSLKLFHSIFPIEVGGKELYVEQMADELCRLLTSHSRSPCKEQSASWHRENTFNVGNQVKNFFDKIDVQLLKLSFVGTHSLFDHLDVVLFGDASHVRDSWNSKFLSLSDLTQEINFFELVNRELQVVLHVFEKDLIENLLALSVNKTITEYTLGLVDEGRDQRTSIRDLISQELEN